jgi:hypothetical protein
MVLKGNTLRTLFFRYIIFIVLFKFCLSYPAETFSYNRFQLVFRKGKKTDSMRFSSEWRSTILTEALRLIQKSGHESVNSKVIAAPSSSSFLWTAAWFQRMVRPGNGPLSISLRTKKVLHGEGMLHVLWVSNVFFLP